MIIKRTILFCAASLAALILTVPAQANQRIEKYPKNWTWKQEKAKVYANGTGRPKWMDPLYFAIAACEQPHGNNGVKWDAYSSGYEGGFGFAHGSWDDFKYPGYPDSAIKASTWQQYRVAKRIHAHYGNFSGWGCYTGGGYKYHL